MTEYLKPTFTVAASTPKVDVQCSSVSHVWVLGKTRCQCGKLETQEGLRDAPLPQ